MAASNGTEDTQLDLLQAVDSTCKRADDIGFAPKPNPTDCAKGVDYKTTLIAWAKNVNQENLTWDSQVKATRCSVDGENLTLAERIARGHQEKKCSYDKKLFCPKEAATPSQTPSITPRASLCSSGAGDSELSCPKQASSSQTSSIKTGAFLSGGSTELQRSSNDTKLFCPKDATPSQTPSITPGAFSCSSGASDSDLSCPKQATSFQSPAMRTRAFLACGGIPGQSSSNDTKLYCPKQATPSLKLTMTAGAFLSVTGVMVSDKLKEAIASITGSSGASIPEPPGQVLIAMMIVLFAFVIPWLAARIFISLRRNNNNR